MLSKLRIRNFALIDEVELNFSSNLNVITGETGAGKTIIVGALGLLLGARADSSKLGKVSDCSSIEGLFNLNLPERFTAFVDQNDEQLVISRKFTASGNSSCYINGSLSTVAGLADLGRQLVDIHSQNNQQSLFSAAVQQELLDRYGDESILSLKTKLSQLLKKYRKTSNELEKICQAKLAAEEKRELWLFQAREIEEGQLQLGEKEKLQEELKQLSHYHKIAEAVSEAKNNLENDIESGVIDQLRSSIAEISKVAGFSSNLSQIAENLNSALSCLEEALLQLSSYADQLYYDPKRLDLVQDRLFFLENLERKYGKSIEEIIKYSQEIKAKLDSVAEFDEHLDRIKTDERRLAQQMKEVSNKLEQSRHETAIKLEREVGNQLNELGMEKADFKVDFTPQKLCDTTIGAITVGTPKFLISTNPKQEFLPLKKVASGGEISRLMLAIKIVLAKVDAVPVMVFDEIDTGIGGQTASTVAKKLRRLASSCQVICITHLPQIAAIADRHFQVEKNINKEGKAVTRVIQLSFEQRVKEIANLSGGKISSATAVKHARQLLLDAQKVSLSKDATPC